MKRLLAAILGQLVVQTTFAQAEPQQPKTYAPRSVASDVYIRTENYPRPPYSGATYYIYERNAQVICTKLEECSKYGQCSVRYVNGAYKDDQDVQTGEPYAKTAPTAIPRASLKRHACLARRRVD